MRGTLSFLFAATVLLASSASFPGAEQSQPPPQPLIDCTDEQLLQRLPSLRGVRFDRSPQLLKSTLDSMGQALDTSMSSFVDVFAQEEISLLRLEHDGTDADARHEEFRHVIHLPTGQATGSELRRLHETRLAANENKIAPPGGTGYFVLRRFMNLLEFLLPENRGASKFRAVGRQGSSAAELVVLVYANLPGSALDSGLVAKEGGTPEPMQGVVWVDAKTGWPAKVIVEPLGSLIEAGLGELRIELVTAPVSFATIDATLLLPVLVTTHVRKSTVFSQAAHRLTGYRLYGVDAGGDPESERRNAGVVAAQPASRDAYELLAQGVSLRLERKDAAAVAPLSEAVRLDPGLPAARLHLGLALDATGDSVGAETQLREAVKLPGGTASPHYALGVVLYHRGLAAEAAVEFREAVRLSPQDPQGHGNLAMALGKLGDAKGALDELRTALRLDPGNAVLKGKLEQLTKASVEASQRGGEEVATIRVDVRQVVVPVMVLDMEGHHVRGLKQADFRVLEDGAEQTITAFQVESSGDAAAEVESKPGAPIPADHPEAALANPGFPAVRHTYLICIDTVHAQFGNLHAVREALQKFFQSQRAGDSQYAVMAIGQSMSVVRNLTQNPAEVISSLDDKNFSRMALGSQTSSWESTLRRYMNELNEVRAQVDSPVPIERDMGLIRMRGLPVEAEALASEDRMRSVTLLGQLRSLVTQLSKGNEHRTVLLFSDGFQISAGREIWELLLVYFPELSRYALRTQDRLSSEFDGVVKVAARHNVIINTIDSRGLYTPSFFDASMGSVGANVAPRVMSVMSSLQSEAGAALMEIAAATGGSAYFNSNDILEGIQKAVAEGREYYTLAYVPRNSAMDGKYRAIGVEVKGRKLTVKAKRGYWAAESK